VFNIQAKFEVSSFSRSQDMQGVFVYKRSGVSPCISSLFRKKGELLVIHINVDFSK